MLSPCCHRDFSYQTKSGESAEFIGAGDRNRTYDLRVTSALLYRLSYTGWVWCVR